MRGNIFRSAVLLLALVRSASPLFAAEYRMVGSDLFGIKFSKALYEFSGKSGIPLVVAFDGSRPGLAELQAGRAEIALLTLPPDEPANLAPFHLVTVAYHRVVVVAPADCSLAALTFEELMGVFASSGAAHRDKWGDLGMKGEWAGSPILALAPAVGTSIAAELFAHVVMARRTFKSNIGRYRNAEQLVSEFSSGARVLALATEFPPDAPRLKMIAVAPRASAPAFLPTPDNLHSGGYPLRLPVRLVVRREVLPQLFALVRFLCGDEGARHFEKAGVVPLPRFARGQQLLALENR